MNKMAMNESVAATCCYRFETVNFAAIQQILHGGYITDIMVTEIDLKPGIAISDAWKAYGKYPAWPDAAGYLKNYTPVKGDFDANPATADSWMLKKGDTVIGVPNDFVDYDLTNPATCPYVWEVTEWKLNQHVGSTTAHSTDDGAFAKAHKATQYAS
jgi:hypothetical protein